MFYDIIFLIIIVIFAIIGFTCGFSKILRRVFSVVCAFFLTLFAAHYLAELIYNVFMRSAVISNINSAVHQSGLDNALDKAGQLLSSFPAFLTNVFEYFEITQSSLASLINDSATESIESLFMTPIVGLMSVLIFILLFGFIFFLCSKLFKAVFKLFRLPVIRILDSVAGLLFGIIEGLIVVYIFTLLLRIIIPLTDGEWLFINESYIKESFVFSKLYFGGIINFFQSTVFRFNAI